MGTKAKSKPKRYQDMTLDEWREWSGNILADAEALVAAYSNLRDATLTYCEQAEQLGAAADASGIDPCIDVINDTCDIRALGGRLEQLHNSVTTAIAAAQLRHVQANRLPVEAGCVVQFINDDAMRALKGPAKWTLELNRASWDAYKLVVPHGWPKAGHRRVAQLNMLTSSFLWNVELRERVKDKVPALPRHGADDRWGRGSTSWQDVMFMKRRKATVREPLSAYDEWVNAVIDVKETCERSMLEVLKPVFEALSMPVAVPNGADGALCTHHHVEVVRGRVHGYMHVVDVHRNALLVMVDGAHMVVHVDAVERVEPAIEAHESV